MTAEKSELIEKEITLDPDNWDKLRLLGHRMLDDMIRYIRFECLNSFRLSIQNFIDNGGLVIPLKRQLSREHFVQQDTERPEIRSVIDLGGLNLLGRHVGDRTECRTHLG